MLGEVTGIITDSMAVNVSKPQELVKDGGAWRAAIHGVTESDMTDGLNNNWRRQWQPTPVFLPGESH